MIAHDEKILIPGGAGLVGQNLVARLKERGYRNIVVLDKHHTNLLILKKLHPDITVDEVDLADPGPWGEHFHEAKVIIMLQAQIGGNIYKDFVRNNIDSTRLILDQARRNNVQYLIHISSSVIESVANDFYTNTKKEQERLVMESGIPSPILRPTLMFGWFDRKHLGWLSRFMKRIPVFPIPGHGRYMRQPLYVGDFCNIIIACMEKRVTSGVFNISGHERVDYIDIIRGIKKATSSPAIIIRIPYSLFYSLLWIWSLFDRNPPFTTQQLVALTAKDEFEVIDWPKIFDVCYTPFATALEETFNDPRYSHITLEF